MRAPKASARVRELGPFPWAVLLHLVARAPVSFLLRDPDTPHAWVAGVDPDQVVVLPGHVPVPSHAWAWPDLPPGPSPPFGSLASGWVGAVSYELSYPLLSLPWRPTSGPLMGFAHFPEVVYWTPGGAVLLSRTPRSAALARALTRARPYPEGPLPALRLVSPGPPLSAFAAHVHRLQEAMRRGDTYVANLTYRLRLSPLADPLSAWRRLQRLHPSPHAGVLRLGSLWLLSLSPETFLVRRGTALYTRPIKGTRPRRPDPRADGAAARTLAADTKERAELTMVVDVERNDMGRVALPGSVRLVTPGRLLPLSYVHHLEAAVRAESLATSAQVLRAVFPTASVTGAPKRRTVELLGDLEADPRGLYTGAMGWVDDDGDMMFSVTIRTLVATPAETVYGVGSGITVDSDPVREYRETWHKARFLLRELGVAVPPDGE